MAALEVLTMVTTQPNRLSTGHGPALGKPKQEEMLGNLGDSFKLIESVLGTLTKFRGIVSKENTGTTPTMKELPNTQQKTRTSENSHACEKNMDNKTRL